VARWRSAETVRLSHRIEALGIRIGVGLFMRLSHRAALGLGAAMGSLAYRLGIRRRVVLENIRKAGVVADEAEVVATARETYRNLGRTFAEYARLPRTTLAELSERVEMVGIENMRAALAPGRGAIAVSGHFGSLELMATAFRTADIRPTLLVAPMRNPLATRYFREHRAAYGVDVIEVGPGLRDAFRVLKRGGLLCLAADQDAGRHGMFVDFLGRPASTPTGAVELAMRTGAPIVFGLCFREGVERHRVVIRPPFFVDADGPPERVLHEQLTRLNRWLEEGIRERPDHWFWLHRRWKTRPARPGVPTDTGHPAA
jgi:KDO2-lipid IV(A) lauroyltransferase